MRLATWMYSHWDPAAKRVWAIECKAIAIGITPWELSHELGRIHEPGTGILAKHERRAAWLRRHLKELVGALGHDPRGWQLEPVVVVEVDLLATHLRPSSMPIVDLGRLEQLLERPSGRVASRGRHILLHGPSLRGGKRLNHQEWGHCRP